MQTPDTTTTEEPSDSAVHASQSTFHETEMARLLDIDVTRPMKVGPWFDPGMYHFSLPQYVSAEILRVGYKGHTLSEPFAKYHTCPIASTVIGESQVLTASQPLRRHDSARHAPAGQLPSLGDLASL